MRRRLFDITVALCGVGGTMLAIGVSKDPISKIIGLPAHLYTALTLGGATLAAVGLAGFLLSFVIEPLQNSVTRVIYGDLESPYICTFASPSDLLGLHALYAEAFGNEAPSIDLMRSLLTRYPRSFALIHRTSKRAGLPTNQKLVGSFKVLPLSAAGVTAVELGQATGSTFRPEHVCSTRGRAVAFYIGDVIGTTRFARAIVMAHLTATCSLITASVPFYARPLTADGCRIMTKNGFVQVSDGESAPVIGRMCRLEPKGTSEPPSSAREKRRRLLPQE